MLGTDRCLEAVLVGHRDAAAVDAEHGRRRAGERGEEKCLQLGRAAEELMGQGCGTKVQHPPARSSWLGVERECVPACAVEQPGLRPLAAVDACHQHAGIVFCVRDQRAPARAESAVGEGEQSLGHAPPGGITVGDRERPLRVAVDPR